MRGGPKTLIVAVVALLLAAGMVACGGGDDSGSTTTEADAQAQAGNGSSGDASSKGGDSGGQGSSSGAKEEGTSAESGSGDFTPKQHDDSGGGSEQLKVKGGDNSVQEFGAEADASEFAAAATALHNFLDARAAKDWGAACEYLAKSVAASLEKLAAQAKQVEDTSCGGILEKLTNPDAMQLLEEEAEKADVRSLRVEGAQAFVLYTGLDDTVLAMPMNDEGGSWKVASLAGTPLS